MVVGWVLWPIILVVTCMIQSLPRLVRRWSVPVLAGVVAFPVNFAALIVLSHVGPEKFSSENNRAGLAFLVHWWQRWRLVGPATWLSDGWIRRYQPVPTDKEMFLAWVHVSLAASVTVAAAAVVLVFLYAVGQTLAANTDPFAGGHP